MAGSVQPGLQTVHVNRPLTNISQAYMQNQTDYIADRLAPVVPVQKQSDLYFTYTKGDWFRNVAQQRGPATESAGGGYNLSTASYNAKVWAFHKDVDEQVRANTDDPLNADRDATLFVTQMILLQREYQTLSTLFTTSVWTGSSTGSDVTPSPKWDAANSTPLEDMETQIWAVKKITGQFPNRLVLGVNVWKALKNHDEIVQRVKYTAGPARAITTDMIAALVAPPGVTDFEVLVTDAIYNTAAEGATDSYSFIGTATQALLLHAAPNPGIMIPSSAYLFTWVGLLGAGAFGARISQIPMNWLGVGTVRTEAELAFVPAIIGADLGAMLVGVTA